jgi:mannose-6-phosphate isomerase
VHVSDLGPVVLGPNQPQRFYRGGEKIAAFRAGAGPGAGPGGQPSAPVRSLDPPGPGQDGDHRPEDWVGSTTTVFGSQTDGLTRLPGGRLLRDAIDADPESYLGPEHVQRHGSSTALLVKLLDAGERLPVHCHPDDVFARRHLASPWGKTEAWIVIDAAPGSAVHLGFREAVPGETLARWVAGQDPAMLRALNRVAVRPGDAILVPAGLPHAIGAGVFIVELQEPTDLSVLLEWDAFPVDGRAEGHLGLGFDLALGCVDRSAWPPAQIAGLHVPDGAAAERRVTAVFPPAADPYFAAERIRPGPGAVRLDPGFAVLIVIAGRGLLCSERGEIPLSGGMTVLVPYAAGRTEITGHCELVGCLPPNGSAPDRHS